MMTEKEENLYNLFGFGINQVNYLINISETYKYIYFETPKVGCSTIKRTLHKLEVDNLSDIPEDVHDKNSSPLLSPLELEKNFTEYLNDDYFKFTFVRNPYTRILSCYLDKIVGRSKIVFLPKIGFDPSAELSFKEFLLAVKKQSYAEMDSHWKPQSVLLAADSISLDFIGRQENFDNDIQKALAIINKTESNLNTIENEAPHAVGANKKLQEYITDDIANLIQEIYTDDFSLYGYSKDPFSTDVLPPVDLNISKNCKLVSIVIPCFNQAQYLEKCVESAVIQTYPNIEIIIVNDGSTDNTQETAEDLKSKYPNKIHIVSQINQGLSTARNNGIKASLGEYILPLDADDLIDKTMISKSLRTMDHYNVDLVSTDAQTFGKHLYKIIPKEFPECNLLYANCWVVCSLYRREVWIKTSGYKKNMEGGYEDWEFWINAYKQGFKFKRYPEVLFHYRTKEDSMYTNAMNKDTYLKSKIVMNHPEMYPIFQVQEAITHIRKTEDLSDLYFYYDKDIPVSEKILITEVEYYISNHPLERKQIVQIDNKKVGLCNLELFKNSKSLQRLYEKMDVDFLLFYNPMRYELVTLRTSSFAWKKNEGVRKAHGTLFPFVSKSKRENSKKQLIAYQRLLKYQTKQQQLILENKTKILTNKEILIQEKDKLIENKNKVITDKINSLQKLHAEVNDTNNNIKTLMSAIQKITKFPITRSPVHKYKAYKIMLKTFHKLQRLKYAKK